MGVATPTFFLVGAPKAGTTSLFRYLGRHPEIGVASVKEPCFFAPEVPVAPAIEPHRRTWDAYLALFEHSLNKRVIGEGSVAYLGSLTAASAIRARIPDARIIMMLRDPAERLFAHYSAARIGGATIRTFEDWLADEQRLEGERSPVYGAVWAGRYATHLTRYQTHFPAERIHVEFYEDFTRDPDAVLARLFLFLGVDPAVVIGRTERHNVTTVAKWPALGGLRRPVGWVMRRVLPNGAFDRMRDWSRRPFHLTPSADDRVRAIALYRNEIQSLSRLTGRDLSRWLAT